MVDLHGPRLVGYIIQVAVRIRKFVVDRRRRHLIADGQHGDARLDSARAAQQVPGHRLRGTHRYLVRMLAERALDRHRLRPVAHLRGRAVRVDVIDLLRNQFGVLESVAHHAECATLSRTPNWFRSRSITSTRTARPRRWATGRRRWRSSARSASMRTR